MTDLLDGERGDMLSGKIEVSSIVVRKTQVSITYPWHSAPILRLAIGSGGMIDLQTELSDRATRPSSNLIAKSTTSDHF